jgi:hypothetical protein
MKTLMDFHLPVSVLPLIRDSVRKMTLPQGSQPMKNNYTPYGGQRLQKLPSNVRTLSKATVLSAL